MITNLEYILHCNLRLFILLFFLINLYRSFLQGIYMYIIIYVIQNMYPTHKNDSTVVIYVMVDNLF